MLLTYARSAAAWQQVCQLAPQCKRERQRESTEQQSKYHSSTSTIKSPLNQCSVTCNATKERRQIREKDSQQGCPVHAGFNHEQGEVQRKQINKRNTRASQPQVSSRGQGATTTSLALSWGSNHTTCKRCVPCYLSGASRLGHGPLQGGGLLRAQLACCQPISDQQALTCCLATVSRTRPPKAAAT